MAGAACEGNGMSDERIGEAVIKEVFEEELKDVPSEDFPPLTPLTSELHSAQEQKIVTELAKMIRIVGDSVRDNRQLDDAIDGMRRTPGSKWDMFQKVADNVFQDGITWERIAVLFYVAGRLAVKLVEAHLPQSVREILQWTVDFFRTNLLGWIREHGGWISSFPALASASMRSVGSVGWGVYGVLIFIAGLALGSLFTARLLSRT
ncbi:unnamed protein product [Knipowitschia caucasica]|uniref:Bcl-2 Bcl-2 homology region 1-3 domain-containing protein n=1 Tax=Knipowitschia caucasica TaxID=637954 RepID=A0AAV2M172_KNICA